MNDPALLVTAILSGEVHRFSEVVERYDSVVRGIVRRSVRDPDSREELVQQTFYLAFKRLESLQDPARFEGWLRRIAANCVSDYHRRLRRRRDAEHAVEQASPDAVRVSPPSWIWEETKRLSPGFAEVLELRYRRGLSYKEIAAALHLPESTIRGRIYESAPSTPSTTRRRKDLPMNREPLPTCEQIRPLLFASLEDGLDGVERRDVTTHLTLCAACREELERERTLTRMLREGSAVETRSTASARTWARVVGLAAAVAIVAITLTFFLSPQKPVYGVISSTRALLPTMSLEGEEAVALEESNHVAVPAGATADIDISGVGSLHAVGPTVFELDHTNDLWKLTIHEGSVTAVLADGASLSVASVHGARVVGAGETLIEVSPHFFGKQPRTAAGESVAQRLRRALDLFFDKKQQEASVQLASLVADSAASAKQRAKARFYLAAAHSNRGRYAEALEQIEVWLAEAKPQAHGWQTALYMQGLAYFKLGQAKRSEQVWEDLLSRFPDTNYAPYVQSFLNLDHVDAIEKSQPASYTPIAPNAQQEKDGPRDGGGTAVRVPYLVVTVGLENGNREHKKFAGVAKDIAKFHEARIQAFDGNDFDALKGILDGARPENVLFVVPPEVFDINMHRKIVLSAQLDDDVFPDFAFGYFTARNSKVLKSLWKRTVALHRGGFRNKTWIKTSVVSSKGRKSYRGGKESLLDTYRAAGFDGSSLSYSIIENDPTVLDFVKRNLKELEQASVISMSGNGDPQGIWLFDGKRNAQRDKQWPFDPRKVGFDPKGEMPRITADYFRRLRLNSPIIWSGTCHSGATQRVFVEGDIVSTFGYSANTELYDLKPQESMCLSLLDAGAAALLVPLGGNHGWNCLNESHHALTYGASLGETMKSTYDDVYWRADGKPTLVLRTAGEKRRYGLENVMAGGGANRILIGDPALRVFSANKHPRETIEIREGTTERGRGTEHTMHVDVTWDDGFHPWKWNIFGEDRKINGRIKTRVDYADIVPKAFLLGQNESDKKAPPLTAVTCTVSGRNGVPIDNKVHFAREEFHGKEYLHLQVDFDNDTVDYKYQKAEFVLTFGSAEERGTAVRPKEPVRPKESEGPRVVWSKPTKAPSYGSGAAADLDGDGDLEIVFGSYFNDETVYALNGNDGSVVWTVPTEGGPADASVLIHDVNRDGKLEVLFADSATGKLFCVNGRGKEVWSFRGQSGTDSPPSAADLDGDGTIEVVYGTFPDFRGKGRKNPKPDPAHINVIDGRTGKLKWSARAPGYIQSEPGLVDLNGDRVLDIVVANWRGDNHLRAFNGRNGKPLWQFETNDWIYHGVSFANFDRDKAPEIVTIDRRGNVWLLDGRNGKKQWHTQLSGERKGSVFAPTSLVDVNGDGLHEIAICGHGVHVVDAIGKILWERKFGRTSIARGAAVGDVNGDGKPDLVFGSGSKLWAVRSDDGSDIWSIDLKVGNDKYEDIDHAPLIADFDGNGTVDVFVVIGRGLSGETVKENYGAAVLVDTGAPATAGNTWTTFRGGPRRGGFRVDEGVGVTKQRF